VSRRRFTWHHGLIGAAVAGLIAATTLTAAQAQGMDGPGPYGMGPGGPGMGPGDMGPDDGPGGVGPDDGPGMGGPMGGRMRGGGRRGGMDDEGGGAADMTEHEVAVNGVQRAYYVHVPQNVGHPAPVVFVFHGGGGRPQGIARKSNMDEVADQNGFVVVYPEGSASPSGRGGTWNIGGKQTVSGSDDVAYVDAVLKDLGANVQIDPTRIYAAGHSMGGVFAYRLACEMSGTFAAIAPVSATMVEPACHPTSPVAVLHIQGAADDRIPLRGGRGRMTREGRDWPAPSKGVAAWSRFDACAATPTSKTEGIATCESYSGCKAPVEMCVLAGEGHPWPQDAAPKIWAFFAAHPKVSQ
jgi:polyhydroxybutyrate depolymerase